MFALRITDVVKHLLIINILMYIGAWILLQGNRDLLAMWYPLPEQMIQYEYIKPYLKDFQPFQIVTHMFMHGSEGHLFFNMLGLFFFGPYLESLWGPKRFLFFYLFCGFGALATNLIVDFIVVNYYGGMAGAVWGASGAIFGILIGCSLKFPDNTVQLIIPPIPIQMKHLAPIYILLELFLGTSPVLNTGVAHFAHLGGALFGFLLIWYWDRFGSRL